MLNKELVSIGLVIFMCITAAGGYIYLKKPFSIKSNPTIAYAQPTQTVQNGPHNILQKQSPFESLANESSQNSSNISKPAISVMDKPPIAVDNMKNFSMLQAMPMSTTLYVKSIIISKSGRHTAVIANDTDEISVKPGTRSKFGYITAITPDGVEIDNKFISLQAQLPLTSNPPITGGF